MAVGQSISRENYSVGLMSIYLKDLGYKLKLHQNRRINWTTVEPVACNSLKGLSTSLKNVPTAPKCDKIKD